MSLAALALLVFLLVSDWRARRRRPTPGQAPEDVPATRIEPPPERELDVQLPYAQLSEVAPEPVLVAPRPQSPVEPAHTVPAEPARPARPARRPGVARVLLVGPEPGDGSIALRALVRAGYDVVRAAGAAEGIATHRTSDPPPDLVVANAFPPGLTGATLAERLHAVDPGLPIVLLSGFSPTVVSAPPDVRVLAGPPAPEELLVVVADALAEVSVPPPGHDGPGG